MNTYLIVTDDAEESIPFILMRLVFRADASLKIGSGHVMRCSAIAEEAIAHRIDCILVGSLGGVRWLESRFAEIRCPVISIEEFPKSQSDDVLVVDSYLLQEDDDFIKENLWKSRVDIVDESTPARKSDLYIHPGLESQWFEGDRAKFLFGPRFIPLRKSITKSIQFKTERLGKIVIFGGGVDTYGFARIMAKKICGLPGYEKAIFISGEQNYIEELDARYKVVPFGSALDSELSDADLVFTTASTSSLEIIAREIPLGVACSVNNQIAYYEAIEKSKVAAKIGERTTTGEWELRSDVISELIFDTSFRELLRSAAHEFIDLSGSRRILEAIAAL